MKLRKKRIYEEPEPNDGVRVLIDRLWPRGVSKERAAIDFWARDLSPSTELRRWYGHAPARWEAFQERYFEEIDSNPDALHALRDALNPNGQNTIVFASKEPKLNNATALILYLERNPASG